MSAKLQNSLVDNYKTKQVVLNRLAPTSLAESSELAHEVAKKNKELADKDKELSKQREATLKMKRKLQVNKQAHLAKRAMRNQETAPTEYFSCTEGTSTPNKGIVCAV